MSTLMELLKNPFISVVLIGLAGSIGYALKDIPAKGFSIFKDKVVSEFIFTAQIFEQDDLFEIFEKWLFDNYQGVYKDVHASISNTSQDSDRSYSSKRAIPKVKVKQAPNIFTITVEGKRVFIIKEEQKIEHATSISQMYGYKYILKGYRAKNQILNLLQEVTNLHYESIPKNTVCIRTHDTYGCWEMSNKVTVKPLDKIIIKQELKEFLSQDLLTFINSKWWYAETSIPYKRMYCFYGQPGTGKTSLALGIAAKLNRDIYVINLNSLVDDTALQRAFRHLPSDAVILLEDVDTAFNGREIKNTKVSFSALLNCTDGVFHKEGMIIVLTTNHIDQLDPALLRAGRTDVKMEIGYPEIEQIQEFMKLFYSAPIILPEGLVNNSLPMAEIQEICIINKDDAHAGKQTIIKKIKAGCYERV